ncbi:MAG: hypothetical protein NTV93_13460 [Verrucomicrobia bacterium]|nr:hypothetical protein [Verrucomicrobiota bacterium]
MNITMRSLLLSIAAAGVLLPSTSRAEDALRVYYIGNSVTDALNYPALAELAQSRGTKIDWGRTMIPGAPLEWIYTHPGDGFQNPPFGTWEKALNDFAWDAVSLQPFDRRFSNPNAQTGEDLGDLALICKFAEMAAKKNPDVQIYILARWPRITSDGKDPGFDKNDYDPSKPGSGADLSAADTFQERWNAPYKAEGYDLTNEAADYFDQLLVAVTDQATFLKKPPLLVPVGHVMAALDQKMQAGKVPGYTNIYQFYRDPIHLSESGSYLVGCTYFACLLKQSPVGLPTAPYGTIDPELAKIIQETAWEVVSNHPKSGVKKN